MRDILRTLVGLALMTGLLLGGHWIGMHIPTGGRQPFPQRDALDWVAAAVFGGAFAGIGLMLITVLCIGAHSIGELFIPPKKKETPDGPEAYPQT